MWKGTKPSAQPQSYRDRRNSNHGRIFGEKEERPAKAAVLGVKACSQLGFSLRQVKRRAVGFRHHGYCKNKKRDQPERKEFKRKPYLLCLLRLNNANHAQSSGAGSV